MSSCRIKLNQTKNFKSISLKGNHQIIKFKFQILNLNHQDFPHLEEIKLSDLEIKKSKTSFIKHYRMLQANKN